VGEVLAKEAKEAKEEDAKEEIDIEGRQKLAEGKGPEKGRPELSMKPLQARTSFFHTYLTF
jgi:hypothetical protein